MNRDNIINSDFYKKLTALKQFFRIMDVKPVHVIIPMVLSLITASNERLRDLEFRSEKILRLIPPIQELIIMAALLFMASIAAFLLAKSKPAEISVFIVFFYMARRSLPMFNVFNDLRASFAKAKPPIKEILKVLDDSDKFIVPEGKQVFRGLQNDIKFVNLHFSYMKETEVLKNINLFIERGKLTAIVGPSGAGKTTLVSLLMRFYDCAPGSIFIDGIDIREFNLKSLREHTALVSQEVLFFNDTFRNNILFGALEKKLTEEDLISVTKKARIYDFISHLPKGFDTEIGDRGVKLSGGEKQRITIARALLKGSKILILDEATSSLDSMTEKSIQEAIEEAVKDKTTIVIAHRLSTIKHADKIVVMEDGSICEEGTMDELLDKKGKFYEYRQLQKFY